jgi:hypothetical protein
MSEICGCGVGEYETFWDFTERMLPFWRTLVPQRQEIL